MTDQQSRAFEIPRRPARDNAGTTSKSLGPGLRLGWLVVPPDRLDWVLAAKTLSDGHNSVLDQLTLPSTSGPAATTAICVGCDCDTNADAINCCSRSPPSGALK